MRLRDRPAIGGKSEGTPPAMMPPAEAIAEPGGSNRLFSMETACASQIRPAMMPPAGAIAEPGGSNHLLSNTNAPFAFRALCHLASRLRRCLRREASTWVGAGRFAYRSTLWVASTLHFVSGGGIIVGGVRRYRKARSIDLDLAFLLFWGESLGTSFG